MRRLLAIVGAVAFAAALAIPVHAKADTWTLLGETIDNRWPGTPTYCWSEDDFHYRNWGGSLTVPFTATEQMCDEAVDRDDDGTPVGAGAEGINISFHTEGHDLPAINQLGIRAPDGTFHPAELSGTTTSHGVTQYNYTACWMPPFHDTDPPFVNFPIAGGIYTIVVDGTFTTTNTYLTVVVRLSSPSYQRSVCPLDQQNIIP
jgi:hypothetical protein